MPFCKRSSIFSPLYCLHLRDSNLPVPIHRSPKPKTVGMEMKSGIECSLTGSGATPERRRVGLIYDDRMCKHRAPPPEDEDHPECPDRIRVIWDRLNSCGLVQRCIVLNAKAAEDNHLLLVHTKNHINLIRNISVRKSEESRKQTATRFNSVYFNDGSSEAAYLAVGSVMEVAVKVAEGKLDSAFAIVRPPGHHAEATAPMGFCLYNNVAVATSFLLNERRDLGIKKILIVDWDVHHGNGTQHMFYKDPRVLFFSVHRHEVGTFFPGSDDGSYVRTGEGAGAGYNINVPWESGKREDADYQAVWDHILIPVAKKFNPDMIMISAGFDAAKGDHLGGCHVTPQGFAIMLGKLMKFAGGKIIMALEGGYNLNSLAKSVQACIEMLLGDKLVSASMEAYPSESTMRIIQEVRQYLSKYWQILAGVLPSKVVCKKTTQNKIDGLLEVNPVHTAEDIIQPFTNLNVMKMAEIRKPGMASLPW